MTYEELVQMSLQLPGVEESISFGTPALKVRGKLLTRWREADVIVLRVDIIEKQMLLDTQPDIFFTSPHYDGYPAVLVHISRIGPEQMLALLETYWRRVAGTRLVKTLDASRASRAAVRMVTCDRAPS